MAEYNAVFPTDADMNVSFEQVTTVETADYNKLYNKPQINDVELAGNISFDDLGLDDYIRNETEGKFVEVEPGKGLSEENYTSAEKTKLAGIAEGAEVNVNADWDATEGDAAILNKPTIPSKTSDLTNDSGFITGYTETDPTVPSWAKQPNKPTYTASEVGALPDTTEIPTKTSDLTNDSGFISVETDPTVPSWAKQASKPTYTASEVGALPDDTVIPTKTSDLTNDSGFIVTETDPTVPSWAKQTNKPTYTASEVGALPDTTVIPSKTSDLTNDSGFITAETDPTVPAWAKAQTKPSYSYSEISGTPTLATVAISGNYDDLSNKPTVDTAMSSSSTNAIANSTVKAYIDGLVGDVESLLAAI